MFIFKITLNFLCTSFEKFSSKLNNNTNLYLVMDSVNSGLNDISAVKCYLLLTTEINIVTTTIVHAIQLHKKRENVNFFVIMWIQ